jgi:putative tryptophan/tyrosine transport system substrate-binding protein
VISISNFTGFEPAEIDGLMADLSTGAKAATIAILMNPDNRNHPPHVRTLEAVARAGGQQIIVISAAADRDFEPAYATLVQQHADALVVGADPFFDIRREQIVGLTTRYAVRTIFQYVIP